MTTLLLIQYLAINQLVRFVLFGIGLIIDNRRDVFILVLDILFLVRISPIFYWFYQGWNETNENDHKL